MSFPGLHRDDIRSHHLRDEYWQITATVLGMWCAGLLLWVLLLKRKARR